MWQRLVTRSPQAAIVAGGCWCAAARCLSSVRPRSVTTSWDWSSRGGAAASTAESSLHRVHFRARNAASSAQRITCGRAVYPYASVRYASGGVASSHGRRPVVDEFSLHARMVLQTARVALDTRDADKIRGAKVRVWLATAIAPTRPS